MKEATRAASQLAKENHQLKPEEVQSLRAVVIHGYQRDLARVLELEGKCRFPLISRFLRPTPYFLQRSGLKGKLAMVETELLLVREALKT
jgi:hypothetical protein